ncbi:MAG: ATP-binding protein [Acidimicrobiales bacterium]|jgi:two-component system sensor histidine kinase MprB
MTLRVRIATVVGAVVALSVAMTTLVAAWSAQREVFDPVDRGLVGRSDFIAEVATAAIGLARGGFIGTDGSEPERLGGLRRQPGDPVLIRLVLNDGTVVGLPSEELPEDLLTEADFRLIDAAPGTAELSTRELDGQSFRVVARSLDGGAVFLAQDITSLEGSLSSLVRRLAVTGLAGVAVAIAAGWLVARRIAQPIVRVSQAARELASSQDLPSRIVSNRSDEVGDLADSFNELVDALETSRIQQRRLVADASHELRTPLTSLRIRIETLAVHPDLDLDKRNQLTRAAVGELETLTDLVSELVDLATDIEHTDEEPVDTNLGELVSSVVQSTRTRTGRKIELEVDSTWLELCPRMTARAVSNLVDNAIKYSPDGDEILVTQSGDRIEVADRGIGLADDERPRAFERFYRAPASQVLPGSGIGLAIVSHVADAHDGEVWFEPREGGGSRVGFSLSGASA